MDTYRLSSERSKVISRVAEDLMTLGVDDDNPFVRLGTKISKRVGMSGDDYTLSPIEADAVVATTDHLLALGVNPMARFIRLGLDVAEATDNGTHLHVNEQLSKRESLRSEVRRAGSLRGIQFSGKDVNRLYHEPGL